MDQNLPTSQFKLSKSDSNLQNLLKHVTCLQNKVPYIKWIISIPAQRIGIVEVGFFCNIVGPLSHRWLFAQKCLKSWHRWAKSQPPQLNVLKSTKEIKRKLLLSLRTWKQFHFPIVKMIKFVLVQCLPSCPLAHLWVLLQGWPSSIRCSEFTTTTDFTTCGIYYTVHTHRIHNFCFILHCFLIGYHWFLATLHRSTSMYTS